MKVELWPLERIKPYLRNPHKNERGRGLVAASLREFKPRQPIVVDNDGVIIVGHTRYWAALDLGLKKFPVHVAADLTPAQVKAYRIKDNQCAESGEWDLEFLPLELGDLQTAGYDLETLGFDGDQLARFLGNDLAEGLTDPDDVPAPPDEATTQPGDLWVLGNHRLLCGDSSQAADVDRLLAGQSVQLVNTDPPYNVNVEPASSGADTGGQRPGKRPRHEPSWRSLDAQRARDIKPDRQTQAAPKKTAAKGRRLMGDFVSDAEFAKRLLAWFGNIARVLEPGRCFYLWGGYANIANYPGALRASHLYMSQCVIWVKGHPVITRKDFMGDHEWCFYGWREGKAHVFLGPNNVTDVWSVKKVSPQKMVHLTEKPVELAVRAMHYSSRAGERVLDLFGGSGSTLIAAEQTDRHARLMELDPLYCDVIVTRWEAFTGKKAKRSVDAARSGGGRSTKGRRSRKSA